MADKRKANGGKRPNAGRKSKAEELGLQHLLDKCWTLSERESVIKSLAKNASAGDLESVKLLLAYTYGKPTERKEISGPNNGPVRFTLMIDNADSGAGQ